MDFDVADTFPTKELQDQPVGIRIPEEESEVEAGESRRQTQTCSHC